jgi:hypothetical protein
MKIHYDDDDGPATGMICRSHLLVSMIAWRPARDTWEEVLSWGIRRAG